MNYSQEIPICMSQSYHEGMLRETSHGLKKERPQFFRNIIDRELLSEGGSNSVTNAKKTTSSQKTNILQMGASVWTCELDAKVIASGNNSLKTLGIPTIQVQIFDVWLGKGLIHYVILEIPSGPLMGQIPALLLSHQRLPKKCLATPFGDLLPLVYQKTPKGDDIMIQSMLNDPFFRKLFMSDSKFKLIWIKTGRLWIDDPELLRKEIFSDIKNMPAKLLQLKPVLPRVLKVSDDQYQKSEGELSVSVDKKEEKISSGFDLNLSDIFPDLRLRGLKASAGKRDFASWFTAIPPDVKVDSDFRCDKGILRKDAFCCSSMLDKYLGL